MPKVLKEAIGIKNNEWILFNNVLNELSKTSTNKTLIKEFSDFLKDTLDKDTLRKQKSWERIEAKRKLNPSYAREKNIKENLKVKHRYLKESKRNLKESAIDVYDDLLDRAKLYIDGGYEVDDAVWEAIDNGLISTTDEMEILTDIFSIRDLYYDASGKGDYEPVSTAITERIYDEIYSDVSDYYEEKKESKEDIEESLSDETELKKEVKSIRNFMKKSGMPPRKSEKEHKDFLRALKKTRDKEKKEINESITVEIDEDEALDMLMNRLKHWTNDRVAYDLYEQMYESYIDGGAFDGDTFNVMQIVDNDWVNYCEVVEPGDDEHHYDELLKIYEEQGIGDVSTEDVGFGFIEAVVDTNDGPCFLCRW